MKVFRTALIAILGVLAGLFLARYLPHETAPPASPPPAAKSAPRVIADTRLAAPTLTLTGQAAGKLQSRSLATVVGAPNIVVAAIADFVGAPRLAVETSDGRVVPVTAVVAADERYGIAALRTAQALDGVEILQPEPGSGSLYLGRIVMMLTDTTSYRGEVYSPAIQDELGAYHYTLKTADQTAAGAAAIIDPKTRKLLGFSTAGKDAAIAADAIDSDPVNQLLAAIGQQPIRTLQDFANFYFSETTAGRLALLQQLVASEQLDSAIRFGISILNLDDYTQRNSEPLLHEAYAGAARQAMDNSQWRSAIGLLNDAEQSVGLNDVLRLMRAEAYQAVGELELALDDLLNLQNPNAHRVRMMVIENALAAGQNGDQSGLSLLERALASDPDFAPYHRLLGETLARQGDMGGALAALEKALALDPAMAAELDPLVQRLRARRDTPPLTEVPIQRQGNTLYVNARINGSTETFRFLFDTGASYTAITAETALRLGINTIFFGAPIVELETANGRVYTTTAKLDSIDVSGARVNNVEAVVLESMRGVDGLLGQSFLRHFDIDINRSRGVIAFNRRLGE